MVGVLCVGGSPTSGLGYPQGKLLIAGALDPQAHYAAHVSVVTRSGRGSAEPDPRVASSTSSGPTQAPEGSLSSRRPLSSPPVQVAVEEENPGPITRSRSKSVGANVQSRGVTGAVVPPSRDERMHKLIPSHPASGSQGSRETQPDPYPGIVTRSRSATARNTLASGTGNGPPVTSAPLTSPAATPSTSAARSTSGQHPSIHSEQGSRSRQPRSISEQGSRSRVHSGDTLSTPIVQSEQGREPPARFAFKPSQGPKLQPGQGRGKASKAPTQETSRPSIKTERGSGPPSLKGDPETWDLFAGLEEENANWEPQPAVPGPPPPPLWSLQDEQDWMEAIIMEEDSSTATHQGHWTPSECSEKSEPHSPGTPPFPAPGDDIQFSTCEGPDFEEQEPGKTFAFGVNPSDWPKILETGIRLAPGEEVTLCLTRKLVTHDITIFMDYQQCLDQLDVHWLVSDAAATSGTPPEGIIPASLFRWAEHTDTEEIIWMKGDPLPTTSRNHPAHQPIPTSFAFAHR